jgi:hypothetical protein
MKLTEREERLSVGPLIRASISLILLEQILGQYPRTPSGERNARRRIATLVSTETLTPVRVFCHRLLPITAPLQVWAPGDAWPDPAAVSRKCKSRWTEPPRPVTAYVLSRKARRIYGGPAPCRIKSESHVTHDAHLASLYLELVRRDPEIADLWTGEHVNAPERKHQKLPDAVLRTREGRTLKVIDWGGAYTHERIHALIQDCAERDLPIVIW